MRSLFFAILLYAATIPSLSGQTLSISGIVTDASTGAPVAGASVFFSSTSYGVVSSSNGTFNITGIQPGKYDLIVSSVGYETFSQTISLTISITGKTIALKQKAALLNEVIVRRYLKDGFKQWGQFFLDNFIGTSAFSKDCSIKNIKALKFSYSKQSGELNVDATEPLLIENKALGYNIQYQLENFTFHFDTKLLFYAGYTFFTEMEGNHRKQQRWKTARAEAYEVSQLRFMRSLFRNRLAEDGYQLYRLERIPNVARQRMQAKQRFYYDTVKHHGVIINYENTLPPDSAEQFSRIMAQKDPIEIVHPGMLTGADIAYAADSATAVLDIKDYLIVRYPKRTIPAEYAAIIRDGSVKQPVSSVLYTMDKQRVFVTANGYYYDVMHLVSEGFWGWWEKVGNLLPYDYTP